MQHNRCYIVVLYLYCSDSIDINIQCCRRWLNGLCNMLYYGLLNDTKTKGSVMCASISITIVVVLDGAKHAVVRRRIPRITAGAEHILLCIFFYQCSSFAIIQAAHYISTIFSQSNRPSLFFYSKMQFKQVLIRTTCLE